MTLFLPAGIFSVLVLGHGCRAVRLDLRASSSGVQTDIPGVEGDRTGCEEVARVLKSHFGTWHGTRACFLFYSRRATLRPHSVLFPFFFLSGPHFASSALLLISCYPGLRLTRRFRLRAPRVSIFPSPPFNSALNGRNVLIWSFSFLCLLVFFS